jgi:D-proline reductase (dithiol) PrdB
VRRSRRFGGTAGGAAIRSGGRLVDAPVAEDARKRLADTPAGDPLSDALIRKNAEQMPVPDLGEPAFVRPPVLVGARVAIVTTAALHVPGTVPARGGDASFRVIEGGAELRLGHESPNFDRSGWLYDTNVVFPLDRLRELADAGTIGGVAPRHLSFAGNQQPETLTAIGLDSGPAAATLLREDGVDVVLLTPV